MRPSALLLAAALILPVAGCAASPSAAPATAAPTAAAVPTAAALPTVAAVSPRPTARVGTVLPPVLLTPGTTSAGLRVGQFAVFSVDSPADWTAVAAPAGIVEVTQGTAVNGVATNPGAKALKIGTATVTLTRAGATPLVFTLKVEGVVLQ